MTNPSSNALTFANCSACPLRYNPVVGSGCATANLAIVGEGTGYYDQRFKKPFSGDSGNLLDQILTSAGTDRSDVWTTNAVLCRCIDSSGADVPPPREAIEACRPRLIKELEEVAPNLILTLGASAARSVLQSKRTIGEIQGVVEYHDAFTAPVLPTYHPAAVMLGNSEDMFEELFSSVKRAVRIADGRQTLPDRNEKIPVLHVTSQTKAISVLNELKAGKAGKLLAFDFETGNLDIVSAPLLQIAISNTEKAVVFEADLLKYPLFKRALISLMSDTSFQWIIHNSSFDLQWMFKYLNVDPLGELPHVHDTMAMALGLTEHSRKVGLKALSREYANAPYYEDEVHTYLNAKKDNWVDVPRAVLAKYAGLDCVYTARIYPILDQLCREENTLDLVRTVLEPAQRTFADVEKHGVLVDQTYLASLEDLWIPRIEKALLDIQDYARRMGWSNQVPATRKNKRVETYAVDVPAWVYTTKNGKEKVTRNERVGREKGGFGITISETKTRTVYDVVMVDEPLNPKSVPQLQRFIYGTLRLKPIMGEKKTGKEFRLEYPNHDFAKLLEEYSLMNHMMNTYVMGIKDDIRADGRVHPSIMLAAARTGRLGMHNPPLQTIPKLMDERFSSIKRMFLPSPGHLWLSVDYAQLEIRCAWYLSGDEELGKAVMAGDYHTEMAARVNNKPVSEVTEDERQAAKITNFGIFYGITATGLTDRLRERGLDATVEDSQELINGVFKAIPKYAAWYKEQHRQALLEGRSVSPFGRVRRWNLITRENKGSVLNQAVNFPVQSLATDLNLLQFIKLNRELQLRGWGRALFLVHDSIEFEIREGKEQLAVPFIISEMKKWPLDNPHNAILDVDAKIGKTWGDLVKWKED